MVDAVKRVGVVDETHIELLLVLVGLLDDALEIGNVIASCRAFAEWCLKLG